MQCWIYRSSVRDGLYVWLRDEDGLEQLPDPVRRQLGQAELAMSIELTASSTLGQEDPAEVLENLSAQGFHVQMPRDIEPELLRVSRESVQDR